MSGAAKGEGDARVMVPPASAPCHATSEAGEGEVSRVNHRGEDKAYGMWAI